MVDVGCGHGDFLLNRVFKEPETLFIGIEIARKRANKASHRLFKRHIENYRVIRSGRGACAEVSVSRCFGGRDSHQFSRTVAERPASGKTAL